MIDWTVGVVSGVGWAALCGMALLDGRSCPLLYAPQTNQPPHPGEGQALLHSCSRPPGAWSAIHRKLFLGKVLWKWPDAAMVEVIHSLLRFPWYCRRATAHNKKRPLGNARYFCAQFGRQGTFAVPPFVVVSTICSSTNTAIRRILYCSRGWCCCLELLGYERRY